MNIDKKDRAQLKKYFVKNSIPKESEFAELIDGMLNQKEDGIAKPSVTDPLSIQATTDNAGLQKVINFYTDFKEANPAWSLSLNTPDPVNPATPKLGFSINDGDGNNRLFIDKNTGNVGIGTINPNAKLEIKDGDLVLKAATDDPGDIIFIDSSGTQKGRIWSKPAAGAGLCFSSGDNTPDITIDAVGNVGIGTTSPNRTLTIANLIGANYMNIKDGTREILMGVDVDGGIISVMLNHDLSFRTGNNEKMRISASGNVGIGTTIPGAKLDISANSQTSWNGWLEAIRFSRTEHSAITLPGGNLLFGMHSDRNFYFADTKGAGKYVMTINADTGIIKSPMWNVTQIFNNQQGALPKTSLKFTTGGGGLLIIASGSGYGSGKIGMDIQIDNTTIGSAYSYTNETGSHKSFSCNPLVKGGIAAGNHTITLVAIPGTSTDGNDYFSVTVLEFPFQPSSVIVPIIFGPIFTDPIRPVINPIFNP